MTTIYLVNNSLTINNLNFPSSESLESRRKRRILSVKGEQEAQKLAHEPFWQNISVIYSSSFVMSLATAKYLAQALELDINICSELNERLLGNLGSMKIRTLNEMQETDFNYKLPGGESLNEVNHRLNKFLKRILTENHDQTIAVFTHNVAITALLSTYCEKGFNLDNRLILNYHDLAIVDGTWDGIKVIKMEFDNQEIISIKRVK